ncbi:hypothetical protein [Methanolobus vulcani]|uniref:Lipoprotein n=1 Tax=Methanolobus vulcani TaxID=38026 RepID=A0A7Z8KRB9_9EURY|nr:hypothetical protein [Methanolobus vulcani]TQD28267.1 hypothetical protein FKV42_00930 [Methanolobus vulcani]
MKIIRVLILLVLFMLISGCVSTNTPEETVTSFAYSASIGDTNACYGLMSSKYKNNTTFEMFSVHILDDGDNWYEYKFIGIVDGSKKFTNDTVFLDVEYEKESVSDKNTMGLTKILGKAIGQEYVFRKKIELVNESDGWKIEDFHTELR